MTDIAKLTVQFEAETAKFRKQLEQNNKSLESFRRKTEKQLGFIRQSFSTGLGVGLADGIKSALTSIPRFLQSTLNSADTLQKLNQRLGASTEALSQYQFVADRTGVSFSTLTTGWQRASRRIAEAAQGTGEAKTALAELGVNVQRLNQLAPEEQFEVLADAIAGVQNPADRVRIAMKLFDTEGVALLQTMEGGSQAIRDLRDEADRLGLTLDQETADAAARAKDAMTNLSAGTQALGVTMLNTLAPAIETVSNWLQAELPSAAQVAVDAFWELQKFIQQAGNFVTDAFAGIEFALADAADAVGADTLGKAFRKAGEDYAGMAVNFEKAAIRIQRTKIDVPDLPGVSVAGGISTGEFFDPSQRISLADQKTASGGNTKLTESQKALNDLLKEGARLTESLRTPQEAYAAQIERLNDLRDSGAVSQETYNRAVADYQQQLDQATGVIERFSQLQQVIAEVDPVAPLLDQIDALEALQDAFPRYADIIGEQMLNVHDEIDKVNSGLDEQQEKAKELSDTWQSFGEITASAFEDAILSGGNLRDVLKGLEDDLLRLILRNEVTKPLGDALGGVLGRAGGGNGGSFFDAILGVFSGGRASGGDVLPGRSYLIGENGPELLSMGRNGGKVLPSRETRKAIGARNVNLHMTINTPNADSFRSSQTQIMRDARRMISDF